MGCLSKVRLIGSKDVDAQPEKAGDAIQIAPTAVSQILNSSNYSMAQVVAPLFYITVGWGYIRKYILGSTIWNELGIKWLEEKVSGYDVYTLHHH